MKKILCLLFCLGIAFVPKAQPLAEKALADTAAEPKPLFYIGAKLGMNLMPTYKTEALGQMYQPGINTGVSTRIVLTDYLYLSPELLYSVKKKTYAFDEKQSLLSIFTSGLTGNLVDTAILSAITGFVNDTVYSHTEGSVSMSYVELPLLITFHTGAFEFSAGPYFSKLLSISGKEELTQRSALLDLALPFIDTIQFIGPIVSALVNSQFPGYAQPYNSNYSNSDPFRKFDYGFVADLGYHLSPDCRINLRYSLGSLNYRNVPLYKHDVHKSVQLSLCYMIGIKRKKKAGESAPMYDYAPAPKK